ncbi:hypothetical protein [Neobacillus niacini]|nr:hypothetical protein [Neobacillus niacini]MCM3763721.1 hypothetical protein [Neobacillus niacini]
MSKEEFLKRAVKNMDRDVEYQYFKAGDSKRVKISDGDKESGSDTEGRFN